MGSNPNPNWEDLIREPNSETEFHIVEKIQDAFDTGEYGNRGPCFRARFPLDCTHLDADTAFQAHICNLRHIKDTQVFWTWVAHASSRQGNRHSDASRRRAERFIQYATALDALTTMDKPGY